MIKEYLKLASLNVKHRKLRFGLTLLGIVIGIAAIISLITISQGLENFIGEQFEKIGTTRIYIMPESEGFSFSEEGLTTKDVEIVKSISEIEWVNPYLVNSEEIEFSNEKGFVQNIFGVITDDVGKIWEDLDITTESGRFLKDNERGAVQIGYRLAHGFFDRDIKINNQIKIKDKKFKVVGIIAEIGNQEDDTAVTLAMDDMRDLFEKPNEVSFIEAKLKPGTDITQVSDKIQRKMERSRDDDFFNILTPDQLLEQLGSVLQIVQLVLGSIAAISLVVGGIGIMNSMYTSVLQRTKEIGIMKSIGARNSSILILFLLESSLIGLIGGIIGVILGSLIAILVGQLAKQAGFGLLKIIVDFKLILIGLLFSVIVGAASGTLPAYRASMLKPVEALRYG